VYSQVACLRWEGGLAAADGVDHEGQRAGETFQLVGDFAHRFGAHFLIEALGVGVGFDFDALRAAFGGELDGVFEELATHAAVQRAGLNP
jgi:hypothetical protein